VFIGLASRPEGSAGDACVETVIAERVAPGTITAGGGSRERGPLPHLRRATRLDTVANGRRAEPSRVLRP